MAVRIIIGDAVEQLGLLPSESVHCCITSPPYHGLRDYGVAGQIGLEETPQEYIAALVAVFREVRRVLRPDAVIFLNLGDCYLGRQLMMIPARVALALQADGWWLRSEIIWHKPNPMPESVTDRPTSAHEKLFLLAKSERYFYDAMAIQEPFTYGSVIRIGSPYAPATKETRQSEYNAQVSQTGRNRRNVWTIPTQPYTGAHFATFPPALIEPCILAGTSAKGVCADCGAPWVRVVDLGDARRIGGATGCLKPGKASGPMDRGGSGQWDHGHRIMVRDKTTAGWQSSCACDAPAIPATVLDPFGGAGTTALVADRLGRDAVLIELNPEYVAVARARIESDAGMFAEVPEPVRALPLQEMLL